MKIVLITTPVLELQQDRLEAPLGLLYIASYLKKHNINVEIIDLSGKPESQWHIPNGDIYGFTTHSTTYERTLKIKDLAIKVNSKAITVAGGAHASALPQQVSNDFDYVVVGEGEKAMLEIATSMPTKSIIIGKPVYDLDLLPYPDYSLVDIHSYYRSLAGKPCVSILSSRGCPYNCIFCNSITMGAHKPIRYRTVDNVIGEIETLKSRYKISSFRFQDDIFGTKTSWLKEFTNKVRPLNIDYRCFARANYCREPEFVGMLAQGGCRHVSIGVESGSSKILEAMGKDQTVEDIREGIIQAKASGLIVRVYLIVGYPGETWDTIHETIDLMLTCRPHEYIVYPLIPYPGTPLFQNPSMYGIRIIDYDFSKYFQVYGNRQAHFVYELGNVSSATLEKMRHYMIERLAELKWSGESNFI